MISVNLFRSLPDSSSILHSISNTREEHLREIFSNYGVVKRVKLNVRDRTAISQGIAFVEMASNEEAMDAIDHLDGSQIDGMAIRLYYQ